MSPAVFAISPGAGAPGLDAFGQDPWWLILIKAVLIFVISMPIPSPNTTRQVTMTSTSHSVLRSDGQNMG